MTIERLGQRPSMPNGSRAPYSPMVRAGGFVFVSGQLPFDTERRIVPGGIAEHTQQAYENIRSLLGIIDYDLSDIVKTVNYLAHEEDFPAFNVVYESIFGDLLPARSTVCVGLLMPAALEVDAVAYRAA